MSQNCPLCYHDTFSLKNPSPFHLKKCRHCQIVFLDTNRTTELDASTYATQVEEEYFGDEVVMQGRWAMLFDSWNIHRTLARLPSATGKRLLDIGIGSGNFLRGASRAGYHVSGIEASAALAKQVATQEGFPIFVGYVEEYENQLGSSFDVIVMNHILEHVADPIKVLSKIRTLLAPDGILHLALPNFDCWEAHFSGWTSYQPYHLYYFTPPTLKNLLYQCGFEMTEMFTYEPFSGWVNTIARSLMRANEEGKNKKKSPPQEKPPKNSFLRDGFEVARLATGAFLLPARLLQSKLGKGEELVVLATARK